MVAGFFINVESGRIATYAQLIEAGEASETGPPELPWHPVQGPSDGSTALYAVLSWRRGGQTLGMRPWRLRAAADGALLVAGWFGGRILVDPDGPRPALLKAAAGNEVFLSRLGSDGALGWALGAGGLGDDEGIDMAAAVDGTVWAVATTSVPPPSPPPAPR